MAAGWTKIDRKILDILQDDGRISMKDLAQQIGLSISPCQSGSSAWNATA